MWPFALATIGMMLLAIAQIEEGINTLPIALYGLRSYALHLPLAIVIAETLTAEDVRRFGRWLLVLSVPMTALILAQYYAPPISWLNAGAGEDAKQILAAAGHVRPAGTFSYGIGPQSLVMLVAAYVLYALTRPGTYPRWLVWSALLATIADVPLLGSRTVLITMVVLAGFAFSAGVTHAARLADLLKVAALLLIATLVVFQLPFFNDAVDTMSQRWQEASNSEGNVQDVLSTRVLGSFEGGLESVGTTTWLGEGIGMGSSFAAYLKNGSPSFLLAEAEWARVVLEFGPIGGLLFMGARLLFAGYIFLRAMHALKRNATLSWLLVPAVVPLVIMAIMEQPTLLGFMVFGAGICLAAAQTPTVLQPYPGPSRRIL
jgi:hypothetical protein